MLTTVFATRNRAAALPRVLDAFAGLQAPPGGWTLIIVDNGSTDATAAVVQGYAERGCRCGCCIAPRRARTGR